MVLTALVSELTPASQWLSDVFFSLDYLILSFYHSLAEAAGAVLTPVMYVISLTGKGGILLIAVSVVLICFKKTRRTGIYCLTGLAIGVFFTNLTIKPIVQRPRPYNYNADIMSWWKYYGGWSDFEEDFSFPSGHVTAAADFSVAFCMANGKKYIPWAALYILLMGISRNYLMMHYPSDVLFAIIIGTVSGILAGLLVGWGYRKYEERKSLSARKPE